VKHVHVPVDLSIYLGVCRAHVIHHDGAIWHVLFDGQVCKDRLESVRFSPGINNRNVQLKIGTKHQHLNLNKNDSIRDRYLASNTALFLLLKFDLSVFNCIFISMHWNVSLYANIMRVCHKMFG